MPYTYHGINHSIIALSISIVISFAACTPKNAYKAPKVAFTLEEAQLPAYEKEIDHKGIIADKKNIQQDLYILSWKPKPGGITAYCI
jgi:hypothetical protein